MKTSPISIFVNAKLTYDTGNVFMLMLADELERHGQVFRIDLTGTDMNLGDALNVSVRAQSKAFLAYNAVLGDLEVTPGKSIFDVSGIPMIGWLVDHPVHHLARIDGAGPNIAMGCVDRNHVELLGRMSKRPVSSFFCPHFACASAAAADPSASLDAFRVVFPATLAEPSESLAAKIRAKGPAAASALEELTAAAAADAGFDVYGGAIAWLERQGIALVRDDLANFLGLTVVEMDNCIRAKRREDLLVAMREGGIVVDVYGDAPEGHPALRGHRHHGPVPFRDLVQLLREADVVLDSGANFAAGTHERVLTAIALGKCVVTPRNRLWADHLDATQGVFLYRPSEERTAVEWLVEQRAAKKAGRLARDGRARHIVEENFSIARAAERILTMVEVMR
jgi:hypothetical protein